MGGLRQFIPASILAASWTLPGLLDAVSPAFDWDTEAGDARMCFMGNGAMNEFNKQIETQGASKTRINYTGKDTMYGIKFQSYQIPQGTLYMKRHPLLSRHPLYNYSMVMIDGSQLKWVCVRNRDTRFKDNIQHNDEDTRKGQWMTEGSIMIDGSGLTQRYIGGFDN